MPDWKGHIRKTLATIEIDPAREPDLVEEISQHLEAR